MCSSDLFLTLVESPHIEKTYNSPPPRKKPQPQPGREEAADPEDSGNEQSFSAAQPSATHNLMGLQNMDLHRVGDLCALILQIYMILFALLTPSTPLWQTFFVVNAALWRLWYNLGLGYVLDRQSNKRSWTRHFIKYGDDPEEAWRQWKGLYYISMTACYASFIAAAWKMYHLQIGRAHV